MQSGGPAVTCSEELWRSADRLFRSPSVTFTTHRYLNSGLRVVFPNKVPVEDRIVTLCRMSRALAPHSAHNVLHAAVSTYVENLRTGKGVDSSGARRLLGHLSREPCDLGIPPDELHSAIKVPILGDSLDARGLSCLVDLAEAGLATFTSEDKDVLVAATAAFCDEVVEDTDSESDLEDLESSLVNLEELLSLNLGSAIAAIEARRDQAKGTQGGCRG